MTNIELLNEAIEKSGMKVSDVAYKCGLTYQGFQNKRSGIREFKVSEVRALCKALKLTDKQRDGIFFT